MRIGVLFPGLLLFLSVLRSAQQKFYTEPVKIPVFLSGNFGELRTNHFHTGIDIKTLAQTGLDVVAAADGYISRITVSPGGYGNALYIDHPNGTTTLYGHLLSFRADINSYIKALQYEKESFSIDTKLPPDKFRIARGEVIAKSGNSGSSGGPHLHFEVRETYSENPQNPFFLGFNIKDKQPPRIFSLLVSPLNNSSNVGKSGDKKTFQVVPVNGRYLVAGNKPIVCYGEIGLGIDADDYADGTTNRYGIYSLELRIDSAIVYSFTMDRLCFSTSRYINSHFDYGYYYKNRRKYIRTWVEPGNYLQIYQNVINRGIINVEEGETVKADIIAKDAAGNSSTLSVILEGKAENLIRTAPDYSDLFKYNRKNKFENEDLVLTCPIGAFYDDVDFIYSADMQQVPFFSKIHQLHYPSTPIHNPLNLKIKATGYAPELADKLLIAGVDKISGKTSYVGGKFENGWVETSIRSFGNYAVSIDTVAPYIVPLSIVNNAITESNRIRFRISDNFSGINDFRGTIDGKWALFESDIKSDIIVHYFDPERFELKKRHNFQLVITDNQGNESVYESTFWK